MAQEKTEVQKQMQKRRNEKIAIVIMLVIAILLFCAQAYSQTNDTNHFATQNPEPGMIGGMIGVQVSGVDKHGCNLNTFVRTTVYSRDDRVGFNVWATGEMQVSNRTDRILAETVVGCSYRFMLKDYKPVGYIETGLGLGLTNWNTTQFAGYMYVYLPFKKTAITMLASIDGSSSKQGWYRYRNFVMFQLTSDLEDVQLHLGIHCESDACLGPAMQLHWARKRMGFIFAGGHNMERNSAGVSIALFARM